MKYLVMILVLVGANSYGARCKKEFKKLIKAENTDCSVQILNQVHEGKDYSGDNPDHQWRGLVKKFNCKNSADNGRVDVSASFFAKTCKLNEKLEQKQLDCRGVANYASEQSWTSTGFIGCNYLMAYGEVMSQKVDSSNKCEFELELMETQTEMGCENDRNRRFAPFMITAVNRLKKSCKRVGFSKMKYSKVNGIRKVTCEE